MSYISHVKVDNTTYDIKDRTVKNIQLQTENLNDIHPNDTTWYWSGGGNTCENKPNNVNSFGLLCLREASGYIRQIIFVTGSNIFFRVYNGTTWTEWKQLATTEYVNDAFKANDAMIFKGTIGSSGATVTTLPVPHYQGWTYKVATTGSYAGQNCEPGDMIICITDRTTGQNNNDDWTVVQTNMTYSNDAPSDLDSTASAGSSVMVARADHVHKKPNLGNITYEGKISATTQIDSGDKILISDSSDSNIIKNTSINFDGSSEDKALTPKGTWGDFYTEPEIDEKLDEKENLIAKNASGNIAHFEDGLEAPAIDVKVDIEPVQDLHGYDHPWPAGGGKNLFTFTPKTGTSNGVTFTWSSDGTVTATGVVTSGQSNAQQNIPITLPSGNYYFNGGSSSDIYCYIWSTTDNSRAKKWDGSTVSDISIDNNLLEIKIENNKSYVFVCYVRNTAPSGTYTFKPMICASTETDNSFEPYSNICPFSGFSEIKILKTSKNLFDKDHVISGSIINNNGTIQTGYQAAVLSDYIPIKNGICTFSSISLVPNNNADNTLRIGLYDENKNFIRRELSNIAYQNNYHIIKINDPLVKYVRCNVFTSSDNIDTVQLELNTERTEYEPFGNIYSVSFENAETVYGGSLDVTKGILKVTNKLWSTNDRAPSALTSIITLDNLTNFWLYTGSSFITNFNDIKCDTLKFIETGNQSSTFKISPVYQSSLSIVMSTSLVGSTSTSINSYLNEHPMNFWVQLKTPLIYQLTPQQIDILLNTNNIWSDAGNISINYWKNEKIIEHIEQINSKIEQANSEIERKNDIIISTTSGTIISFDDGIESSIVDMTVEIEPPVQDLHGYDAPYPAGSRKNLLVPHAVGSFTAAGITFTYNSDGTVTANGTATAEVVADIEVNLPSGKYKFNGGPLTGQCDIYCWNATDSQRVKKWDETSSSESSRNSDTLQEILIDDTKFINLRCRIFNTAVANNLVFKPMIVSETETNTNFEPYSNICPITGFTEANITRIGKNFLETKPRVKTYESMTVTVNNDGSITLNGTTGSVDYIYCYNLADPTGVYGRQNDNKKHIPNGSYIKPISTDWVLQVFGSNVENAGADDSVLIAYTSDNFTIDDTYKYNWCRLLLCPNKTFNNVTIYPYIYKSDETDLTWESYNGTTYSIALNSAGIVYKGKLNITTGELIVTHKLWSSFQNLTTTSVTYYNGNTRFWLAPGTNYQTYGYPLICDSLKHSNHNTYTPGTINSTSEYPNSLVVVLPTTLVGTTIGTVNAYLQNNPFNVILKLTTPLVYQLNPTEITTLLGKNTLWNNIGNNNIIYYWKDKNIAKYADNIIKQNNYKNNILDIKNADIITNNISNTIVTFNDGSNAPIVDLIAKIEPIQSGTGDPSSSNIRPILGWNKCNITRGGKNLIQRLSNNATLNGLTFTVNNDDSITVTGTASKATYYHFANVDTSKVNIGDILCGCPDGGSSTTYELQLDVDNQLSARDYGNGNNLPVTKLGTNNRIYIYIRNGVTINAVFRPMIFHANEYNRTSISFDSAGTVYGGSLNVNTGILTVDRKIYTIDENTKIGYFVPSTTYGTYGQITVPNLYFNANEATVMSSSCKSVSQADRLIDTGIDRCFTDGGNYIALRASKNSGITTKEELKAHFMGTQLVYKLATPLTYQLTPVEVTTLFGQNTIVADTGAVDVIYRADTKTYVDEKIETSISESETATRTMITQSSENTIVASKNYAVGDLMIINNQLLRAVQAINTGTDITGKTEVVDLATLINAKAEKTQTFPMANNAGSHNSIYRGVSLGTAVTTAQWNAISAGTFEDMYIGDYWTINNIVWRIAGFDYWYNNGDTACETHHVVIVPDTHLAWGKMNSTDITTGAYVGSDFYTGNNDNTAKATVNTIITSTFGNHILSKREYLANETTSTYESSKAWYDSTWELMTEIMVYGSNIYHNIANSTNFPRSIDMNKSQLPLFRLNHCLICYRTSWWLRDVCSAQAFTLISNIGLAFYSVASGNFGIRPAFGIKA